MKKRTAILIIIISVFAFSFSACDSGGVLPDVTAITNETSSQTYSRLQSDTDNTPENPIGGFSGEQTSENNESGAEIDPVAEFKAAVTLIADFDAAADNEGFPDLIEEAENAYRRIDGSLRESVESERLILSAVKKSYADSAAVKDFLRAFGELPSEEAVNADNAAAVIEVRENFLSLIGRVDGELFEELSVYGKNGIETKLADLMKRVRDLLPVYEYFRTTEPDLKGIKVFEDGLTIDLSGWIKGSGASEFEIGGTPLTLCFSSGKNIVVRNAPSSGTLELYASLYNGESAELRLGETSFTLNRSADSAIITFIADDGETVVEVTGNVRIYGVVFKADETFFLG